MPQPKKPLEINKEDLINLINKGYGENRICKELNITPSSYRRHMKAYELKTIHGIFDNSAISKSRLNCLGCNKKCESKRHLCRTCIHRCKTRGLKLYLVNRKGGACELCGFNSSLAALEFHHDGNKSFEINVTNCRKGEIDKYITESDKCRLLCANCHKSHHEKFSLDNPIFSDTIRKSSETILLSVEQKNGT